MPSAPLPGPAANPGTRPKPASAPEPWAPRAREGAARASGQQHPTDSRPQQPEQFQVTAANGAWAQKGVQPAGPHASPRSKSLPSLAEVTSSVSQRLSPPASSSPGQLTWRPPAGTSPPISPEKSLRGPRRRPEARRACSGGRRPVLTLRRLELAVEGAGAAAGCLLRELDTEEPLLWSLSAEAQRGAHRGPPAGTHPAAAVVGHAGPKQGAGGCPADRKGPGSGGLPRLLAAGLPTAPTPAQLTPAPLTPPRSHVLPSTALALGTPTRSRRPSALGSRPSSSSRCISCGGTSE